MNVLPIGPKVNHLVEYYLVSDDVLPRNIHLTGSMVKVWNKMVSGMVRGEEKERTMPGFMDPTALFLA